MSWAPAVRRHWRNMPFAQKLAALLITLVSIPIVIVVIYTTYSTQEALITSARARNLERALGTAQMIDAFFDDARADVLTASALSSIVDLCEGRPVPNREDRALRSLLAVRDAQRVLALYVTDRAGRVLATTDARVEIGSVHAGRAFLAAMSGDIVVDDPAYDPFDRRVALRVSHAVRSARNEIIGTVTALIDVEVIDGLTGHDGNYGGYGEFGLLWTGPGLLLSQSNSAADRFTTLAPLPPETLMTTRQRLGPLYPSRAQHDSAFAAVADRGAWLLYDAGTDPHLRVVSQQLGALQVTAVPLKSMRWVYGIFVPEHRLLAALREQMVSDWAVAFFTVLSALVLSVIAARWVSRPLHRVTSTANALAHGDMSRRVSLDQEDEFGQLGAAFDAMAGTLAEKERQLQAHAAELERRVDERTRTLQLFEHAGRLLAASLEPKVTAANLASLLVPTLADFCSIDISDLHGNLRRLACRHRDPVRERVAKDLPEVRPFRSDAVSPFSAQERDALGLTDVRVYELSAGRHSVGVLSVAMASGRVFREEDERVFEELGRRAGLALANAVLYQEAQDANRLKDEFLGLVSHELRTPLNAIMGWTRLAGLPRETGIDARKALDAIDRNARALARLVDDLLDVPRIMMGKLALDLRPVDLVVVLDASIDAIRPSADSKSLTLTFDADAPSATVQGDAHRLQQVFWNLLSNAVKFTPSNGRIIVRLRRTAESYVVTVADTGVGIRSDFLPYVFDRFRQADSSTTRAHGGLGIGLSIVRHLVEIHGGRVTAESDGLDRGSKFTVELPVTYADPVGLDVTALPGVDPARIDQLRGMRLLVIDDDADARDVLMRLLQSAGATVDSVTSVPEALEALAVPDAYDAVLADIGMPGEDGYAFVAGLRASPDPRLRELPVVAVTAYAARADRERALAAGFDEHVAKPVSLPELSEALRLAAVK